MDLSIGNISSQNPFIWFFAQYRKNDQKFSKKPITRLQRPSGPNPLRVILALWSPNYSQSINSKGIGQLVTFPRKSRIWPNNTILHDHIRSYNKILINLFTLISIFECCYSKYRSNRLRIFQKFFVFRITSLVTCEIH